MRLYLGYLHIALLMEQTPGLSGGVVVVERDFIECILQERILVKGLIADGADPVLSVIEELADVFLGLVVHSLASACFSDSSDKARIIMIPPTLIRNAIAPTENILINRSIGIIPARVAKNIPIDNMLQANIGISIKAIRFSFFI